MTVNLNVLKSGPKLFFPKLLMDINFSKINTVSKKIYITNLDQLKRAREHIFFHVIQSINHSITFYQEL